MKRVLKILLGSALLLVLVATVLTVAVVGGLADALAHPITVQIDDFTLSTTSFSQHWIAASLVLLLALLVVVVVVPLAISFGVLAAMLSAGGVIVGVLLLMAMLLSPLWLLVLLAWWLLRKALGKPQATRGATMQP